MIKLYPLYSSSKGNCTYIGDENNGILIDCGVSCKRAVDALALHGIPVTAVKAVCVTHTHSDHIKGLKILTKKLPLMIVAQQTNLQLLVNEGNVSPYCSLYALEEGGALDICGFEVRPFATSHDTPASCGYTVTLDSGKRVSVCTDLGVVTENVLASIKGSDAALIEANYDKAMLINGYYSEELKARILSDHGHLSNNDSGELAKKLIESGTGKIVLGHLSENNNTPQIAEGTVLESLAGFKRDEDYTLNVASPVFDGLEVEI